MFSLQVILGQDKKFFDLLHGAASEGRASVQAIRHLVESPADSASLQELIAARRHEKELHSTMTDLLCKTFVTVLEREDLEALSDALYKIPKTSEKFGERYLIGRHLLTGNHFARQLPLLERAAELIMAMVKELHQGKLEPLLELNADLQAVEEQADQAITELTCRLFLSQGEMVQAIILKDLYELLEKVVDRCRNAGNIMARIALKHS
jgi:hypothetical protein